MRKYVIAGNWKMHNGPVAAKELASAIAKKNNGKTNPHPRTTKSRMDCNRLRRCDRPHLSPGTAYILQH